MKIELSADQVQDTLVAVMQARNHEKMALARYARSDAGASYHARQLRRLREIETVLQTALGINPRRHAHAQTTEGLVGDHADLRRGQGPD